MSAIRKLIEDMRFELQSDVTPTVIVPIRLRALDAAEAELKELEQLKKDAIELMRVARIRGDERAERDRADTELLEAIRWGYGAQDQLPGEAEDRTVKAALRWAAAKGGAPKPPPTPTCTCVDWGGVTGDRQMLRELSWQDKNCPLHPKGGGK